MSDVNLSISQDVVQPIIQAKIQAAIVAELQGTAAIIDRIVARVLMQKVDDEGKTSCYAREKTFVQWVCEDAVRGATQAAIKESMEKMKPDLQKAIVKELEKRKNELAGRMVGFFVEASSSYYRIKADVSLMPKE